MRAVLCLFVLISTALACPCSPPGGCSCGEKPKICNPAWNVRTFDSQQATTAIQGGWYLQLFSPFLINDANPLKTGLFSPQYPTSNLKIMFNDTTPCDSFDYNSDYIMTDIAYNLATQRVEITKSLFKAAYGNKSPWAIFNIGTAKYYENPIVEINPFTDDLLIRHEIDTIYEREYTLACIGSDELWQDYLIFVLINQYDNFFNIYDKHAVWVFTRSPSPSPATYKKAFDDLKKSGINPYYLMSMDQSVDLASIPTVSIDELYGITTETVTKSTQVTSSDGTTSQSSTTTTVTTVSTVNFVLNPNYVSPYEIDTSPLTGDIKILKLLDTDALTNIFSNKYYLKSAMPCRYYSEDIVVKGGLLNTAFPATSIQVAFDYTNKAPWDYTSTRYMIDRSINAITGEIQVTRSIISSCYDGSHPYNAISVYTEGYGPTPIEEVTILNLDGSVSKSPGSIYIQQYVLCIAGYQKDAFVIFYLANKYNNLFNPNSPVNPLYVLTNDRFPSAKVIEDINQEILRIGYDSRYLTNVDQTTVISDDYIFEESFFYPSVPRSLVGPGPVTPLPDLPSYFPPQYQVKTFESQLATKAIQGGWNLQLYSPTSINNAHALKTGLFYPQFPCSNLKIMFNDTTPCDEFDYNTDFILTDISFNLITQRVETTKSLFKAAYGNKSPYAIFNVGTTKYFETPIVEVNPFTDDLLIRHTIDTTYEREYTIACIGADDLWEDYLIFVLLNQYDNFFSSNDNHIIWMFTRSPNPGPATYKRAFDDLKKSGINPYYLMSMDQSVDLISIPTVSIDELYGITTETVTKSTQVTSSDGTVTTEQSTQVTTVSTIDFVPNPAYISPYEFDTSPLFGDIKIYKDLQPDVLTNIFSNKYYLKSTMPCRYYSEDIDVKVGLLNTAFPATGIQVAFDYTNKATWDYTTTRYMIDRAVNAITGETQVTRSIISSCYDGSHPYNTISVFTEGYGPTPIEEISPLSLDGSICKSPGKLYTQQYIISVVGYQKDDFVILYIANKYKNLFNPDSPFNPLFVLTNERFPSAKVLEDINQAIYLCGYDSRYLSTVDQTITIDEDYVFESSYFEVETVTTSSACQTTVTKSVKSTLKTIC